MPDTLQKLRNEQITTTMTGTMTKPQLKLDISNTTLTPPPTLVNPPYTPRIPKLFNLNSYNKRKKDKRRELGFRVQLKSKGKFIDIPTRGTPNYQAALNIGTATTKKYIERSFRIQPINKQATIVQRSTNQALAQQFYTPAKTQPLRWARVFVQKSKYNLKTPSEKKFINFYGERPKYKKLKNKF